MMQVCGGTLPADAVYSAESKKIGLRCKLVVVDGVKTIMARALPMTLAG